MKGLRLTIYTPSYGNCSNGGVSSKCESLTLVGPGIPEIFEASEEAPAVEIKTGHQGYQYVGLVESRKPSLISPMAGGCMVWSTDSRVREVMPYALSLHDRYETQEEYDALSN